MVYKNGSLINTFTKAGQTGQTGQTGQNRKVMSGYFFLFPISPGIYNKKIKDSFLL
jgi:hypothetical protein